MTSPNATASTICPNLKFWFTLINLCTFWDWRLRTPNMISCFFWDHLLPRVPPTSPAPIIPIFKSWYIVTTCFKRCELQPNRPFHSKLSKQWWHIHIDNSNGYVSYLFKLWQKTSRLPYLLLHVRWLFLLGSMPHEQAQQTVAKVLILCITYLTSISLEKSCEEI